MNIAECGTTTAEREGLATINEACRYLRIGRSLLYELLTQRKLPSCRIGGARRIPWPALREFVAQTIEK